jgi:hypothetical protein
MRSLLWLSSFIFLACAAAAPALDNRNVEGPDQAPVVREVEPFTASITVTNPYDRAVRIATLDATCSCGKLEMGERFLLPHESSQLELSVDNANRSGPQRLTISCYVSDHEYEAIEVEAFWTVRACVQVDSLAGQAGSLQRPASRDYQDIYKYWVKSRPDELAKLDKRLLLSCPAEELPKGGLKVTGIAYEGTLWSFTPTALADGSVWIAAKAKDPAAGIADGLYDEKVVVQTNHPDKARIELTFLALIAKNAGELNFDPDDQR